MVGEPRDRTAYSVALGCLGLGFVVLLAGICWVEVQNGDHSVIDVFTHRCALGAASCRPALYVRATPDTQIAAGLWIALSLAGGTLVGTLIHFAPRALGPDPDQPTYESTVWIWDRPLVAITVIAVAVSALAIVLLADSLLLFALAGLLLGLLIPSPARRE